MQHEFLNYFTLSISVALAVELTVYSRFNKTVSVLYDLALNDKLLFMYISYFADIKDVYKPYDSIIQYIT